MTCHSNPRGPFWLHIWGLMHRMEVGSVELIETGMVPRHGVQTARKVLSSCVYRIKMRVMPDKVFRVNAAGEGFYAIRRTA